MKILGNLGDAIARMNETIFQMGSQIAELKVQLAMAQQEKAQIKSKVDLALSIVKKAPHRSASDYAEGYAEGYNAAVDAMQNALK